MERISRLSFQKLDVYLAARRFVKLAFVVANALPRGEGELRSQLKRAALSIPLNIAEASGKLTDKDKKHVHSIARGSAMECAAGHELIVRIVAMLTRMSR